MLRVFAHYFEIKMKTLDMTETTSLPAASLLARDSETTIAYHYTPGKSPGVVFLSGFMSDMTGSKALKVEAFCQAWGQAFLRFDYTGHGESSGSFVEGTIGQWADDAVFAIENVTEGPQILIGSSMGGWIMLLAALQLRERVAGLLGIAPAPDFTEDLVPNGLSAEQMATLERDGVVNVYSDYGPDPTPFTKALLDEGRNHLLLRRQIPLDCPVRIIHGMKDPDVPWQTSLRLCQMLRTEDMEITFVKDGDHRLSGEADLDRLCSVLESLL
jgi:pimeloyl-ACP methyl ester carboxylesterase